MCDPFVMHRSCFAVPGRYGKSVSLGSAQNPKVCASDEWKDGGSGVQIVWINGGVVEL